MTKTKERLLESKGIPHLSNLSEHHLWNNTKLPPQEMVKQRQFWNQQVQTIPAIITQLITSFVLLFKLISSFGYLRLIATFSELLVVLQ